MLFCFVNGFKKYFFLCSFHKKKLVGSGENTVIQQAVF